MSTDKETDLQPVSHDIVCPEIDCKTTTTCSIQNACSKCNHARQTGSVTELAISFLPIQPPDIKYIGLADLRRHPNALCVLRPDREEQYGQFSHRLSTMDMGSCSLLPGMLHPFVWLGNSCCTHFGLC